MRRQSTIYAILNCRRSVDDAAGAKLTDRTAVDRMLRIELARARIPLHLKTIQNNSLTIVIDRGAQHLEIQPELESGEQNAEEDGD